FVQSMIPQSSKMFGKGAAGGAYKTFLAEQIAAQLAKAGGIGVAGMIDQRVAALKEAAAKSTAGA
ncbi:MAG TPA: rod-binding protein, partial [Beijerinckiaceae bacterium]